MFRQICQKFLIYTIKIHLTHEICQRKFGRVKGALVVMATSLLASAIMCYPL